MDRPQETESVVIKMTGEGVTKDPGTSGSAQNLKIVTFIWKDDEEKDRKYDRYAARREERNLRTKTLERYVYRISEERNLKPRVSALIIFTDEDLATIKSTLRRSSGDQTKNQGRDSFSVPNRWWKQLKCDLLECFAEDGGSRRTDSTSEHPYLCL